MVPGVRGRPPRSLLVRAERGNPVGVRARLGVFGKPTVRRAQLPGGYRMTEKRVPVAERATGNHAGLASPPAGGWWITGRIPGLVPGRESVLTRSGELRQR